jgi:hypothetical protein
VKVLPSLLLIFNKTLKSFRDSTHSVQILSKEKFKFNFTLNQNSCDQTYDFKDEKTVDLITPLQPTVLVSVFSPSPAALNADTTSKLSVIIPAVISGLLFILFLCLIVFYWYILSFVLFF